MLSDNDLYTCITCQYCHIFFPRKLIQSYCISLVSMTTYEYNVRLNSLLFFFSTSKCISFFGETFNKEPTFSHGCQDVFQTAFGNSYAGVVEVILAELNITEASAWCTSAKWPSRWKFSETKIDHRLIDKIQPHCDCHLHQ